jgi:orotate phosphoribosyltransferase
MPEIKHQVAGYLLQSKAIILEPAKPFTWASGWRSPIYCDNRITLSYPEIRDFIRQSFIRLIRKHYPRVEVIAGVATGAIAQGVLVADGMGLPFVYVRSSAKEHGRRNLVEGRLQAGQKVVVVEDLVSTGGSSLKAVEALRNEGAGISGMVAIFSYGFREAEEQFSKAGVELRTLTDYHALIEVALDTGDIRQDQVELLKQWRKDPAAWGRES